MKNKKPFYYNKVKKSDLIEVRNFLKEFDVKVSFNKGEVSYAHVRDSLVKIGKKKPKYCKYFMVCSTS